MKQRQAPPFRSQKAAQYWLWRDLWNLLFIALTAFIARKQFNLTPEKPLGLAIVILGLAAALSLCLRAIKTYRFILSPDFKDLPLETVIRVLICTCCEEAYDPEIAHDSHCRKCGGPLEESEGFYDRHPNFRNRQEYTESHGFLKRLKNDFNAAKSRSRFARRSSPGSKLLCQQRAVRGGISRLIILILLLLAAIGYAAYEIPRAWHELLKLSS